MAVLTAKAGGGKWSAKTTWSPEETPSGTSECVLNEASGNVEVPAGGGSCRSINCQPSSGGNYKGTLTLNGQLAVGGTTADANSIAVKLSTGMTLAGTGTLKVAVNVSAGTEATIQMAGREHLGSMLFEMGNTSKAKLLEELKVAKEVKATKGGLILNGQTVDCEKFLIVNPEPTGTLTITTGAATIKVRGKSGRVVEVGSTLATFTVTMGEATLEIIGTGEEAKEVALENTIAAGGSLPKLLLTADNVTLLVSATPTVPSLTLNTSGNAHKTTVTTSLKLGSAGTISTNGTAGSPVKLGGSSGWKLNRTAGTLNMAAVELDHCTGEGGAAFQADTASVNAGSNSNIKFATLVPLAASAASSVASGQVRTKATVVLASASSTSTASATVHGTPNFTATAAGASSASMTARAATGVALAAAKASSVASAVVLTATYLPLKAAAAVSGAALTARAATGVRLNPASALSVAEAPLHVPTKLGLVSASATSAASGRISVKVKVGLVAASASSTATIVIVTPKFMQLAPASSQSAAQGMVRAASRLELVPASGLSNASAGVAARSRLTLAPASASSAATFTLMTHQRVTLTPAVATSTASLRVYIRVYGRAKTKLGVQYGAATVLEPAGG